MDTIDLTTTPDFHVTISIKNNKLLSLRRKLGLTQRQLAQRIGIGMGSYSQIESMYASPVTNRTEWTGIAQKIANFFRVPPSDLFSQQIINIKETRIEREFTPQQLSFIGASTPELPPTPEELSIRKEQYLTMLSMIYSDTSILTGQERQVLTLYFGLHQNKHHTLEETGTKLHLSKERINQIVKRAVMRLRQSIERQEEQE